MRNLRTVIAITLAASAALSLTGCLGGGKLSTVSLAKAAKEYDAELYEDPDDFSDDLIDGYYDGDFDDGLYISAKGKDVKHIVKDVEFIPDYFYDKSIEESTVFVLGDETFGVFMVSTYESEEKAEEAYETIVEEFQIQLADVRISYTTDHYDQDIDDFEDNGITYTLAYCELHDAYYTPDYAVSLGVYQSGKTVFVAYGIGPDLRSVNDDLDDICDSMGVEAPSEL